MLSARCGRYSRSTFGYFHENALFSSYEEILGSREGLNLDFHGSSVEEKSDGKKVRGKKNINFLVFFWLAKR